MALLTLREWLEVAEDPVIQLPLQPLRGQDYLILHELVLAVDELPALEAHYVVEDQLEVSVALALVILGDCGGPDGEVHQPQDVLADPGVAEGEAVDWEVIQRMVLSRRR